MVDPVKFKNSPVEVCQFSFFLDIIFAWKHQQEFKQFITNIVPKKKTEQSMNETVSNWLFVGQDIPKPDVKEQDESKRSSSSLGHPHFQY